MGTTTEDLARYARIDWSDSRSAYHEANSNLDRLATNLRLVASRLDEIIRDDTSAADCEVDEFRTKIVLYDGLAVGGTGSRLRLHLWKSDFEDVPHQHRFAYVAHPIHGGYDHRVWQVEDTCLQKPDTVHSDEFLDETDDRVNATIRNLRDASPTLIFRPNKGLTYYQAPDGNVSSTLIRGECLSLFLRGPSIRDYSLQLHPGNKVIWRGGRAVADPVHQDSVTGTQNDVIRARTRLAELFNV